MTVNNIRLIPATMVAALLALPASAGEDGWCSLFDGKTLDGWVQRNGTATYRVEEGTIVGYNVYVGGGMGMTISVGAAPAIEV